MKTGIAAAVAFYMARFLKLPKSHWAAIGAIIAFGIVNAALVSVLIRPSRRMQAAMHHS